MLAVARDGRRGGYESLVGPLYSTNNHKKHASSPKVSNFPLEKKRLISRRLVRAEGGTRYAPSAHPSLEDATPPHVGFSQIALGGKAPLGHSPVSQCSKRDNHVREMTYLGCFLQFYEGGCSLAEQPHPSAEATRGPLEEG